MCPFLFTLKHDALSMLGFKDFLFVFFFMFGFLAFSQEKNEDNSFEKIEDVPVYPGCYPVKKDERRECFRVQIQKHIARNFRYPEIAQKKGIQGRVFVQFIVNVDGKVDSIRARGPNVLLEKEAARIISLLPRINPGRIDGKPVPAPFSIPIIFKLQ